MTDMPTDTVVSLNATRNSNADILLKTQGVMPTPATDRRGDATAVAVGDIVTLKSGGPHMTVVEHSDKSERCIWHDNNGHVHDFWLPTLALVHV